jgi:hypothetical protein
MLTRCKYKEGLPLPVWEIKEGWLKTEAILYAGGYLRIGDEVSEIIVPTQESAIRRIMRDVTEIRLIGFDVELLERWRMSFDVVVDFGSYVNSMQNVRVYPEFDEDVELAAFMGDVCVSKQKVSKMFTILNGNSKDAMRFKNSISDWENVWIIDEDHTQFYNILEVD